MSPGEFWQPSVQVAAMYHDDRYGKFSNFLNEHDVFVVISVGRGFGSSAFVYCPQRKTFGYVRTDIRGSLKKLR